MRKRRWARRSSLISVPLSLGDRVSTQHAQHARVYLVPGNKWWNLNPFADPKPISFTSCLQIWSGFQTRSKNHKPQFSVLLCIMKLLFFQFWNHISSYKFNHISNIWEWLSRVTPSSLSYFISAYTALPQIPALLACCCLLKGFVMFIIPLLYPSAHPSITPRSGFRGAMDESSWRQAHWHFCLKLKADLGATP